MVGTFNIEKDKMLAKEQQYWPNSPTYQEDGNPMLTPTEMTLGKETEGMTKEELKEYEKKKSKLIHSIDVNLTIFIFRIGADNGCLRSFSLGKLFSFTFLAGWGEA